MRIVLMNPCFSEGMGYIENCLPKALSSLGHEVFVVTSTGQVYFFDKKLYSSTYEGLLGKSVVEPGVKKIDGYTLHRLYFRLIFGKVILKGLYKTLNEIKPDIVQTLDPFSFLNIQVIMMKSFIGYKVFTANHIMKSVFPPAHYGDGEKYIMRFLFYMTRTLPAKFFNMFVEKSFPITIDAMELSAVYYSYPYEKMRIIPLGVDTKLFTPPVSDEMLLRRKEGRKLIGVCDDEILCIYTGRFSEGKNPLCLAQAISRLRREGEKYKGLFIGHGAQKVDIEESDGCIIVPFVRYNELADTYLLGDIGVWPREESTSMLDASACGLPLVISNTVQADERIKDIGFTYIENSVDDLCSVLLRLKDPLVRRKLGNSGAERMENQYSWIRMAHIRLGEYKQALLID